MSTDGGTPPRPACALGADPPPSPLPCSKKRLSRVGDALVTGEATDEDFTLYATALDAFDQRTTWLRKAIDDVAWSDVLGREVDIAVTARTKTLSTLVDKLERQPHTKLPYVRDITGVRVVGDLLLSEQDAVAAHLGAMLSPWSTSVIDRRIRPESGYRAVHVAVTCFGLPAEIQIRTAPQATWADIYERQADQWGREMRYGHDPVADNSGSNARRVQAVADLQAISLEGIAPIEAFQARIATAEAEISSIEADADAAEGLDAAGRLCSARSELSEVEGSVLELRRLVERLLHQIAASAKQIT